MKYTHKFTVLVAALALALTFFAAAQQDAPSEVTLTVVATRAPSTYLADSEGRTLYVLVENSAGGETTINAQGETGGTGTGGMTNSGTGGTTASMTSLPCEGDCASAWPPFVVAGGNDAVSAGDQVDTSLVSTTTREDGTTQVTYGGYPLYYFSQDEASGDTSGQAVESFGGIWYTLGPDGSPIVGETNE